jgi:hypothetical protein
MDGLAQANLIVTDPERAEELGALFGDESWPRHLDAVVVTFPSGMNPVLYEPELARQIAGSTVAAIELPSREAADDSFALEE